MRLTSLLLTALLAGTTAAANPFDDAVATLVANNLAPRAESLRSQAEIETLKADNQLAPIEAEFSRVWGSNAEVGNKWALSVSQSFDWPAIYAARREAARKAETAAQYLHETTLLDARNEARQLLIDAIHMAQLLKMQTELASQADALVELYRKGAEEGTETRLDYNKTVIERVAIHRELHSLEAQRDELLSQIRTFNGGKDPAELIASVGTEYPVMPLPAVPSITELKEKDPGYAAACAGAEASRSMVRVERMNRLPGFSIGYVHETELGGNFDGFSIGITLPAFGKRRQARAAMLEAEAGMLDAEMRLAQTSATMNADYSRLRTMRQILDEIEPVVNDPSNLQLLQKAFKGGQITYLTFLEEANYFIAARRDYLDTLYDYHTILNRLNRLN